MTPEKVTFGVLVVVFAFTLGVFVMEGYCKIHYFNTPWIEVPYICHV